MGDVRGVYEVLGDVSVSIVSPTYRSDIIHLSLQLDVVTSCVGAVIMRRAACGLQNGRRHYVDITLHPWRTHTCDGGQAEHTVLKLYMSCGSI